MRIVWWNKINGCESSRNAFQNFKQMGKARGKWRQFQWLMMTPSYVSVSSSLLMNTTGNSFLKSKMQWASMVKARQKLDNKKAFEGSLSLPPWIGNWLLFAKFCRQSSDSRRNYLVLNEMKFSIRTWKRHCVDQNGERFFRTGFCCKNKSRTRHWHPMENNARKYFEKILAHKTHTWRLQRLTSRLLEGCLPWLQDSCAFGAKMGGLGLGPGLVCCVFEEPFYFLVKWLCSKTNTRASLNSIPAHFTQSRLLTVGMPEAVCSCFIFDEVKRQFRGTHSHNTTGR